MPGGPARRANKRLAALVLLACCVLAPGATGVAQTREQIENCRAIADEPGRLACYDSIPLAPPLPQASVRSKYELVALADLTSDPLSFRGRLVEVAGWVRPERDLYRLGSAPDAASSIPIDTRALPRQSRDQLLQRCSTGCSATVQGRVAPVAFVTGIIAETVLVR